MPSRRLYGSLLPRGKGQPSAPRACLAGLVTKYGPLDPVGRSYAQATAAMWWSFAQATEELRLAEAKRRDGRGRRPSVAAIEKLRRRQGIAFQSWDAALKRLEDLAAARRARTGATPADILRAMPLEADGRRG